MLLKEMPELDDIMCLRNGGMNELDENHLTKKVAYFFFIEHLLECVAGKKEWKKDKWSCKISNVVSVSDEAFALLLLSNSWEVFKEYAVVKASQEMSGTKLVAKPKYTSKRGGSRRFEGWTRAGIAEYNTLCQRIVQDRNSDMGEQFESEFLEFMKEQNGNKRKRNDESQEEEDENSRPLRAWREDDINVPAKGGGESNICMDDVEQVADV